MLSKQSFYERVGGMDTALACYSSMDIALGSSAAILNFNDSLQTAITLPTPKISWAFFTDEGEGIRK